MALLTGDSLLMPGLAVAGGLLLLVCVAVLVMYNRLVKLRHLCNESFRNIDTELQRRHDLIPNLVETVRAYASHEQAVFEEVARLRASALQLAERPHTGRDMSDTVNAETQRQIGDEEQRLGNAMGQVLMVAERYPQLQADANFRRLMGELSITEDRIQAARRFFNANVRDMNTRCNTIPSAFVAKAFGFHERAYFEVDNPIARHAPNLQNL